MIPAPKARKVVFDTNVYIEAMQGGPVTDIFQLLLSALPRTYLSAIVVQELYTGAMDAVGERLVAQFVRQTERTRRIVPPHIRTGRKPGECWPRSGGKNRLSEPEFPEW